MYYYLYTEADLGGSRGPPLSPQTCMKPQYTER